MQWHHIEESSGNAYLLLFLSCSSRDSDGTRCLDHPQDYLFTFDTVRRFL